MLRVTVKVRVTPSAPTNPLNLYPVGDFGLATSSLAAVDPSDVSPHVVAMEADMTLGGSPSLSPNIFLILEPSEVGTRLYIAPEVQSRKRGPRNHSKADMYSLGVFVSSLFLHSGVLKSVKRSFSLR